MRILIVDDHEMVRDGLKYMLESYLGEQNATISEAESGEKSVEMALKKEFDVILMDYQLTDMDGVEATKQIMGAKPHSCIIALSNYDEYACVTNMLDAGAKGFLLKNVGPYEMSKAIKTVLSGKSYFSNEVALQLMKPYYQKVIDVNQPSSPHKEQILQKLSKREIEVLTLIVKEHTNDQIAQKLNISKRTVDTHRHNAMSKLGVNSSIGLVRFALENDLV